MIELLNFQKEAVQNLIETVANPKAKNTIILKSPTGSGKTVMLINFIDTFIGTIDKNVAFIWLCPGKGNLEEQSHDQMIAQCRRRKVMTLQEALLSGFEEGSTTFINWEMVTKTGNRAIIESEEKNLFERISEAHNKNRKFIIIVDEEHSNDTKKAQLIIEAFLPRYIIRVSATAHYNEKAEFIEIDEQDVIDEEIIAKAVYVNEDIPNGIKVEDETKYLIEKADLKRKQIKKLYDDFKIEVNPLVIIQLPNDKNAKVERTEKILKEMGYTYDSGTVGVWLSDKKQNIDNIKDLNDGVDFLIMKQAISTGWDCPRAKILVKLREAGNEDFEIQTIGRIRRMPERKHYYNDILDNCYVFTFDEEYKAGLFGEIERSYSTIRVIRKNDDDITNFKLMKQNRDDSYIEVDARLVQNKFVEYMREKYRLDKNYADNKAKLESDGYIIGSEIINETLAGKFVKTMDTENPESSQKIKISVIANTHIHGFDLQHSKYEIHKTAFVKYDDISSILLNAFSENGEKKYRLLELENPMFYAFIINNEHKLKEEFREINSGVSKIYTIPKGNEKEWYIPKEDVIRYDPIQVLNVDYKKNVYENYTSRMVNSKCGKSISEMLFEKYCEKAKSVKYVYKNGDKGDEYFSIIYGDLFGRQNLFYPDYIVILEDGTYMIVETKGGEMNGKSKNIDKQIANKFKALKIYAEEKKILWGFVRDKDTSLYINNTEYTDDMNNGNWVPIEEVII